MKLTKQLLSGLALAIAATAASATTIDFKAIANSGEFGAQDFSPVAGVTINGYYNNGADLGYAYLDAFWGGLGVCKIIDQANQCSPSNDDNTTAGESLNFVFKNNTRITSISFNNRHDADFSLLGDKINITGVGDYTFAAADGDGALNGRGNWTYTGLIDINAGSDFNLAYVNEEFYVTSITYATPEPAMLGLLALGLIGVGLNKRKNA